jgi:Lysozyme like domain
MAYSYSQLEGYWISAGGPAAVAPIAAAIALAESAGSNVIQQGQPYSTTGWGLWQITPGNSEPSIGVDNALLDPETNAKAAVAKYEQAGNSFSPWTTYTSGKYEQFLQQGVSPSSGGGGTSTAPGGTSTAGILSWPSDITGFFDDAKTFLDALLWLVNPASWLRIGSFAIGALLLLFAIWIFTKVGSDEPIIRMPSTIPVPV